MSGKNPSYTYQQAGVSIEAGNSLIKAIGPLVKATRRAGADGEIGGFGGFFDPKAAGYKDPLLVAGNDGVGTKVKLAIDHDLHEWIGIDLVAMCANDLIVQGAEPLFFLDYFATGTLDNAVAQRVIAGIAQGCQIAGCALIGGETAEMPGLYAAGDYDLAGFCVGAVERGEQLTGDKVAEGQILLALPSSGAHSNGYSLIRRLAADKGWDMEAPPPFPTTNIISPASPSPASPSPSSPADSADTQKRLIDILIEPTKIYVKSLLPVIKTGKIAALAHITGGGLLENIPRVLPDGLHAVIDSDSWQLSGLMQFLQQQGNIAPEEMARTFNCGIGMVLAVAPQDADDVIQQLQELGESPFAIGTIKAGERGCTVSGSAHVEITASRAAGAEVDSNIAGSNTAGSSTAGSSTGGAKIANSGSGSSWSADADWQAVHLV